MTKSQHRRKETKTNRVMSKLVFYLSLVSVLPSNSILSVEAGPPFSQFAQEISRRGRFTLSQSIPALSVWESNKKGLSSPPEKALEVAKRVKKKLSLPRIDVPKINVSSGLADSGIYYGITRETLTKATKPEENKRMSLSDSMYEALEELKFLREEMTKMRSEMRTLRGRLDGDEVEEDSEEAKARKAMLQRKKAKECEKLSREIEKWAKKIMAETEEDGWRQVECSKMMRKSLNPTGRTTAYIKWMKDSREEKADKNDETEYPCIKCFSVIDAPIEDVCTYLSQENASSEYNDLVVKYKDVEEISPNAKICWSQTPQILFLKPRDFVTMCHFRWKRDGSEVIVNQAWEHEDYPATNEEKEGKACRAASLRGANFFSRCPDDPEKTMITMISHAKPGGNVPGWATKTAVNALAPIEPFKIFHKINESVKRNQPKLRERLQEAEMVSLPGGRSPRPAGLAQLGYACFWPNGGGKIDGGGQKSDISNKETNNESSDPNLEQQQQPKEEQERGEIGDSSSEADTPEYSMKEEYAEAS